MALSAPKSRRRVGLVWLIRAFWKKKRRGKEEKKGKSVELEEKGDLSRGKGESLHCYGIV